MVLFENGTNLKDYDARLRDRVISTVTPERSRVWGDGFKKPFISKPLYKWKKILIAIEFKGDQLQIEENKVLIQEQLDNKIIRFSDLSGIRYVMSIDGDPSIKDNIHRKYQTVEYSLIGYAEEESLKIIKMTGKGSEKIIASDLILESEAVLKIKGSNTATVKIGDDVFEVSDIGSGTVVIGEGKVLKNGLNHWNKANFKKFPKIKAGSNVITYTPTTAEIVIEYRGRLR